MGKESKKKNNSFFSITDNQKTLHKELKFTAKEQYKLLRTNLTFTLPEEAGCKIIGLTSSIRGEGKSTTAVNLSYVLAESGKKVLLVDGDLRIPTIAKKMRIESSLGLADMFGEKPELDLETLKSQQFPNWYILPAGTLPPNPSELLGSPRMGTILKQLSENFDYIVIDLPPVNIVSDALAISKYLTGMIVLVREDYTEKKELDSCLRQLKLSNVKVLGCVMNESKSGKGYYSKYKYKRYYKYYNKYGNYDNANKK